MKTIEAIINRNKPLIYVHDAERIAKIIRKEIRGMLEEKKDPEYYDTDADLQAVRWITIVINDILNDPLLLEKEA